MQREACDAGVASQILLQWGINQTPHFSGSRSCCWFSSLVNFGAIMHKTFQLCDRTTSVLQMDGAATVGHLQFRRFHPRVELMEGPDEKTDLGVVPCGSFTLS